MTGTDLETTLEKVSRVITNRYGLRLVCQGNSCHTDGKTIYLPSLPEDVPGEVLGAIRGWADHECAHALFTRTEMGPEFRQEHGQKPFAILNALEDARVERLMGKKYPGAALNIEDAFRFVSESPEESFTTDPFRHFTSALYTRGSGRPDQGWISGHAYALADTCGEELARLSDCRNTEEVAGIALDVWAKVEGQMPEPSSDQEEDDEKPESQPEQDEPEEENPSPEREQKRSVQESGQGNGASRPAESGPRQGSYSPMDMARDRIEGLLQEAYSSQEGAYRIFTTERDVVEVPEEDPGFDPREEMAELRPYVSGLRRRLLQTLMGQKETRWLGDKTRGNLDPRSLHRLTSARSARVFRRRVTTDGGKTACTLLLDLSSSMNGPQFHLCRKLGLVFGDTLSRLGFPTEIIGFSTLDEDRRPEMAEDLGITMDELCEMFTRLVPTYHAVYKRFGEPWRRAAGRLGNSETRALTPLGESLLFAGRRLASRPESRKVLFCLTDGLPVVGALDEGVTMDHACRAVERLARAGIEPVGIGIQENCVEEIFPRHVVIHRLEELARQFMAQLCSVLSGR